VPALTTGCFTLEIGFALGKRAAISSQKPIIIQPDGTNCNAVGVTAEIHSFTVWIVLAVRMVLAGTWAAQSSPAVRLGPHASRPVNCVCAAS